jgi:hypothetical protein
VLRNRIAVKNQNRNRNRRRDEKGKPMTTPESPPKSERPCFGHSGATQEVTGDYQFPSNAQDQTRESKLVHERVSRAGEALTLHRLPVLLTDCVIVGHAQRADVVFTPPQFFAMCAHMHNENPQNFFLMPYRDKNGKAKFAKAFKTKADDRIQWAWDTIRGTAKLPASVGFYPINAQRQSRWAAMDFDAHDDDPMRARDLAHKAFALLIREPNLFVALTTSAGDPQHSGWHLFIFTKDFYHCEEWTRLLKQVADQIGAPIQPGICEIFPDECKGIGRGIRVPGSWNPKTDNCGLILRETLTKLLPARTPKEVLCSLDARCPTREKSCRTPSSEFFRGEHGEWVTEFGITASGTRHGQLCKLVGTAFLQVSREVARKNADLQHIEANPAPVASLNEHLVEFDKAWAGMQRKWLSKLSPAERIKFDALTTDTERDAFRTLRNWSQTSHPDFKAHCETLGNRLGIELSSAAKIRRRFCSLGILRQTAPYVPHKLAARYRWTAADEPTRKQGALLVNQWQGDPGEQ